MLRLEELIFDRKKDCNQIYLEIKNFIDIYSSEKTHFKNIEKLSSFFEVPKDIIQLKFKRLVYNEFEPNTCKFNNKNNYLKIIITFFQFFLNYLLVIFLGSKRKMKNRFDIIFDDIDNIRQIKKYSKLIKKYNNSLIIINNNKIKKKTKWYSKTKTINPKLLLPVKIFSNSKIFYFFNFILITFIFSLKTKQNFIYFYNKIFLSVLKNETLFNQFRSKYMIYDRFYKSCPIKNFIFKKYGGKYNFCTQYHLVESGISLFNDIDIFLTFGEERRSEKKLRMFGSNVKKSIAIGSLSMESEFFLNKKKNILPEIDLLIIGINPSHWIKVSEMIARDYYEYLRWIELFAREYPKLKIVYKHHSSFKGDKIESEIFKYSKVKIISYDPDYNSYCYLRKSKVAVSYGSTMVLEGIGLQKSCFFVNPNKSASNFYETHDFADSLFLNSYEVFSKTIKEKIENKNNNHFINDEVCINSLNTSERIKRILEIKSL